MTNPMRKKKKLSLVPHVVLGFVLVLVAVYFKVLHIVISKEPPKKKDFGKIFRDTTTIRLQKQRKERIPKEKDPEIKFRGKIRFLATSSTSAIAHPNLFALFQKYDGVGVYPGTKIPRIIHQQWRSSDPSTWSNEITESINSFINNNQDSYHMMWDDADILEFVHSFYPEDISNRFENLPRSIHKSDLFRYMVLQTLGGVYSDVDTICLKPIASWMSSGSAAKGAKNKAKVGVVVGVEADTGDRDDWDKWYARQLQWCQWTIASARGHDILTYVVKSILNKTSHPNETVLEFTGPGIWTDAVNHYIEQKTGHWTDFKSLQGSKQLDDMLALSITGFSPGVGHMGSETIGHPDAMIQHKFLGSWRQAEEVGYLIVK